MYVYSIFLYNSEEKEDTVLTVESAMRNLPSSLEYQTTSLPDAVDLTEIMEVATLALPLQHAFASHTRIWRHYFHKKPECKVRVLSFVIIIMRISMRVSLSFINALIHLMSHRKSSRIASGGVCVSFLAVPWLTVRYAMHIDH